MSRQAAAGERELVFTSGIRQIGREAWNGIAGTANPFTRYEFLEALETTGCADANSGWQPCHVAVYAAVDPSPGREGSRTLAVMPLYVKDNSWGEYVFDWSWADAFQSSGLSYYPKLVTSIPFTPSVGPRLLLADGTDAGSITRLVFDRVREQAEKERASSWHILFPTPEESLLLQQSGLPRRKGCQFQWLNESYSSFDDFLQRMSSRKRKNLRKERQTVSSAGIGFEWLEGGEIEESQWQQFYQFYQNTYLVRGRRGYLSLEFFMTLGETMPENLRLLLAYGGGHCIAGALFLIGEGTLYGRYWGSREDYQFLHFETCYYQGINYCIRHGLKRFDSGAQGEHKIQRGFRPVATWSNHWLGQPEYARAIEDFMEREAAYIDRYMEEASKLLPFKRPQE